MKPLNQMPFFANIPFIIIAILACSPIGVMMTAFGMPDDGLQSRWSADDTAGLKLKNVTETYIKTDVTCDVTLVETWTSSGASPVSVGAYTNSNNRPYWVTNAFLRSDGTYAPAVRMNWRVHADEWDASQRYQHLYQNEGQTTTFGINSDSSWFFVGKIHQKFDSGGTFWGLTGKDVSGNFRFGIFSPGNDSANLRVHNSNNPGNNGNIAMPAFGEAFIIDAMMSEAGYVAGLDGEDRISLAVGSLGVKWGALPEGRFEIGHFGDMLGKGYRPSMDVGEIIVYNRALNAAERLITRNSLAVKYGIALAEAESIYEPEDGWTSEVVGIGSSATAGNGLLAGTAEVSGWCGEMRLERLEGLSEDGEYVFAAKKAGDNGMIVSEIGCARWKRSWRLKRYAASAMSVRMRFRTPEGYGNAQHGVLLRKCAEETVFSALTNVASVAHGSISFDLRDDQIVDSAEYSVAWPEVTMLPGPTLWLTAGEGVETNSSGAVIAWRNRGSEGDELDMLAATGTVYAAKDDVSGMPVMRFPGKSFLLSRGENNYGVATGFDTSWIISYSLNNPVWENSMGNAAGICLFGSELAPRFGAFFSSDRAGLRSYGGASSAGGYLNLGFRENEWSTTDVRSLIGRKILSGAMNGALEADKEIASATVPNNGSRVKVGHFFGESWLDVNVPFTGDIAEIRVYNRAVDDMERLVLQHSAMARYGVSPSVSPSPFASSDPDARVYSADVAGVGALSAGVPSTNFVAVSGGMMMRSLDVPDIGDVLMTGHNGGIGFTPESVRYSIATNRLAREWRIVRTGNVKPVQLSFVVPKSPEVTTGRSTWKLLFRESPGEGFEALDVPASAGEGAVAFELNSGNIETGYYSLGLKNTRPVGSMTIVIR